MDAARRELASLVAQIEVARSTLADLQAQLTHANSSLGQHQLAKLVEANERLQFEAQRAQGNVDTATHALEVASRSAEQDPLTKLPNRLLLLDRCHYGISLCKRHDTRLAVLFLDLNHFKSINDTLGHAAGDAVPQHVARCLLSSVREADTVSRLGGDEFVLLLTDLKERSDVELIAEKIVAALAAPWRLRGRLMRLTASIGISTWPDDGTEPAVLIRRADEAMYRAKRLGSGSYSF